MTLEGRKTLVWGTIAAAIASALWLGASDGSLPRLGGAAARAGSEDQPRSRLERHAPVPAAPSRAR